MPVFICYANKEPKHSVKGVCFSETSEREYHFIGSSFQGDKIEIPLIAGHSSFFCTPPPAWHRACWKILQRSQQNFEPLWYFYLMLFLLRACQLHWFLKMEHGWRDIPLVIANPPLEKSSLTLVSQGELIFGKSMTDSQGKS